MLGLRATRSPHLPHMLVVRPRRTPRGALKQAQQKSEPQGKTKGAREGEQAFLPLTPCEELEHEQADATGHVCCEQQYEACFSKLYKWLIRPSQERLQTRFAL